MKRDILWVDGIAPETKAELQAAAMHQFGQANASLMVRHLIGAHLAKQVNSLRTLTADETGDSVRVELRLPRQVVSKIDELAEASFSRRNYYLASIVFAHLGQPQLQGAEIEVLRRSNYEMSKVGTNLNQIAKAFNTLVLSGGGKMPEIGKKIASLRREITEHTGKVLRVLNAGTSVWENTGRGINRKAPRNTKGKKHA